MAIRCNLSPRPQPHTSYSPSLSKYTYKGILNTGFSPYPTTTAVPSLYSASSLCVPLLYKYCGAVPAAVGGSSSGLSLIQIPPTHYRILSRPVAGAGINPQIPRKVELYGSKNPTTRSYYPPSATPVIHHYTTQPQQIVAAVYGQCSIGLVSDFPDNGAM